MLPFGEAAPGATGLELLLPLALKWSQRHAASSADSLSRAIAKITCDPARILQVACGELTLGHTADICIFDPAAKWIVDPSRFASQGKHTPFAGRELTGVVKMTIVEGRVAYERSLR
jgi:dihydroorotase